MQSLTFLSQFFTGLFFNSGHRHPDVSYLIEHTLEINKTTIFQENKQLLSFPSSPSFCLPNLARHQWIKARSTSLVIKDTWGPFLDRRKYPGKWWKNDNKHDQVDWKTSLGLESGCGLFASWIEQRKNDWSIVFAKHSSTCCQSWTRLQCCHLDIWWHHINSKREKRLFFSIRINQINPMVWLVVRFFNWRWHLIEAKSDGMSHQSNFSRWPIEPVLVAVSKVWPPVAAKVLIWRQLDGLTASGKWTHQLVWLGSQER